MVFNVIRIILNYTLVAGFVLIGVGLIKLGRRYDSVVILLGAIGLFILAGLMADPIDIIWEMFYIMYGSTGAMILNQLMFAGIRLFGTLCAAIGIFLAREDTENSMFAVLGAVGFLIWGVVPFVESILFIIFYSVWWSMPMWVYNTIVMSLWYVPTLIGLLFGTLYMWFDRFQR